MITLADIHRLFRSDEVETTALRSIDLSIDEGEFVAIMGPSGCGKSTLLNVIGMIDRPTSGRYLFRGEEIIDRDEAALARLRRGQSLDLRLTLGDTRPALVLPNGAWMEGSGGAFAFVLKPGDGRAERRAIAIGRRNPTQVEVAKGLRPGERVVVSSYSGLEPYKHLILR